MKGSLTISQLIKELQVLQVQLGDKEVMLSTDPEGNAFGRIDPDVSYGEMDDFIILYPANQITFF